MIIKENWFYKLSDLNDTNIVIDKWVIASFFDNWDNKVNVTLLENSRVDFFWYYKNEWDFWINFLQESDNSILKVKYLLTSKENKKLTSKIYSKISSDKSSSDVKIISIVSDNWNIDLDWIIEIDK